METVPNTPLPPLRIALWHFDECGCDECWREALDAIRNDRLRDSVDRARSGRRDRGSALLEVLVAIVVLGIVAIPMTNFVVTILRTVEQAQRTAERVALVTTATSIVGRVEVVDPCDGDELAAAVHDRLGFAPGWSLAVVSDCGTTAGLAVISVDVVDPRGMRAALTTSRVVTP
jgi:Tfp pilus assembly protein PilV